VISKKAYKYGSVADRNQVRFYPWIRDGKNIRIRRDLKQFFFVKNTEILFKRIRDLLDPGSGIKKKSIRDQEEIPDPKH
jgi:hypothetical protein